MACDATFFDSIFEQEAFYNRIYAVSYGTPRYIYLIIHQVRFDMRGHGRSDKPVSENSYEPQRYVDDFEAVSQAFGLHKPFYAGW
jgi:pimeloyl-ACP methyl ester carboxylesterase